MGAPAGLEAHSLTKNLMSASVSVRPLLLRKALISLAQAVIRSTWGMLAVRSVSTAL